MAPTKESRHLKNRNRNRPRREAAPAPGPFAEARDEMFQHIMKCGVTGAHPEDQKEWFESTMSYLAERYHELSPAQIAELRVLGERFAQPPKAKAAV